jgi:hypothetical protein
MPYLDDKAQFFVHKDSTYLDELRKLSSVPDFHRPPSERFLNAFYGSVTDASTDPSRVLPHSDLFYVRAALEAKFPDRLFTMQEIKELILEIYGVTY